MQRKLVGFWNIETDKSYYESDCTYYFLSTIIYIKSKDTIQLPRINSFNKEAFERITANATGSWEIVSRNPDSILIHAPKHPLNGKYALRFFIDRNGYLNMKNNIYKMELKNDSTLLICNKGDIIFKNDAKNWEE